MEAGVKLLANNGIQVIRQTGKSFGDRGLRAAKGINGVVVTPFISDMAAAYKAADLVVVVPELTQYPSFKLSANRRYSSLPNVAEDHQTHNARALADVGAAVLIIDAEARQKLVGEAISLIADKPRLQSMAANIRKMGITDSAHRIADEVCKIINISEK